MANMSNWMDLGLSKEQEDLVQKGAALYKAHYLDTIDTVFTIAKAIEVLRTANYGTGTQGGFAQALIQYGFTNRDGGPMDKGIRSNFNALLDNEDEVRAWWNSVPERQKRDWLSARAIYKNWQASKRPKTPKPPKPPTTWPNRTMPVEPKTEAWMQPGGGKPSADRMEAKQRQEAETEAKHLEMQAATDDTINSLKEELQRLRIERAGLLSEIEELKGKVAELETGPPPSSFSSFWASRLL